MQSPALSAWREMPVAGCFRLGTTRIWRKASSHPRHTMAGSPGGSAPVTRRRQRPEHTSVREHLCLESHVICGHITMIVVMLLTLQCHSSHRRRGSARGNVIHVSNTPIFGESFENGRAYSHFHQLLPVAYQGLLKGEECGRNQL